MLGEVVGNYKITGKIGEGGMGAVYLAQHQLIGHEVAIKVLLPAFSQKEELVARFFNEAKAATAIKHPAIVEIYDFGYHVDHSAYIVMERLEGESLESRIRRFRNLSDVQAINVTRQVASALAAAHDAGIVHRDLKPDNIFIVPDPDMPGGERAKILDFGIAKLAAEERKGSYKTRTGSLMGTPAYMAPEQCRGAGEVDYRADLYSLGCILFEMLCGRPPFVGDGIGEVLAAHIHVAPPSPRSLNSSIHPNVEMVVHHLMAKDPAQRLGDARQLIRVLDQVSGGQLRTGDTGQVMPAANTAQVGAVTPPPSGFVGVPTPLPGGYGRDYTPPPGGYGGDYTPPPGGYGGNLTPPPGGYGGNLTPPPGGYGGNLTPPPSGFVGVPTPPPTSQLPSQPAVTTFSAATGSVEGTSTRPPGTGRSKVWIPLVVALALGAAGAGVAFVKLGGSGDEEGPAEPEPAAPVPAPTATPGEGEDPGAPTVTPIDEPSASGQPAVAAPVEPAPPASDSPAPAPPASVRNVKVTIKTQPRGATVYRMPGEVEVGRTPFEERVAASNYDLVFVVKKEGYQDETVSLPGAKGGSKRLTLARAVGKPPVEPSTPVAAPTPDKPVTPPQQDKPPPAQGKPVTTSAKKAGTSGGPCYGNGTCNKGLTCDNRTKTCLMARGSFGNACYPNGTCDKGLSCNRDRNLCVRAGTRGTEGGPCYPNRTCNQGLACASGVCKRYQ